MKVDEVRAMAKPRRTPTRYVSFDVYAVREASGPRWIMVETSIDGDALNAVLTDHGLAPETRHKITFGSHRADLAPAFAVLPRADAFNYSCGSGWAYDDASSSWRMPGEALTPPPGVPVQVEHLSATFARPDSGCVDISIAGADKLRSSWRATSTIRFSTS